jgi:hypothetical protein
MALRRLESGSADSLRRCIATIALHGTIAVGPRPPGPGGPVHISATSPFAYVYAHVCAVVSVRTCVWACAGANLCVCVSLARDRSLAHGMLGYVRTRVIRELRREFSSDVRRAFTTGSGISIVSSAYRNTNANAAKVGRASRALGDTLRALPGLPACTNTTGTVGLDGAMRRVGAGKGR